MDKRNLHEPRQNPCMTVPSAVFHGKMHGHRQATRLFPWKQACWEGRSFTWEMARQAFCGVSLWNNLNAFELPGTLSDIATMEPTPSRANFPSLGKVPSEPATPSGKAAKPSHHQCQPTQICSIALDCIISFILLSVCTNPRLKPTKTKNKTTDHGPLQQW